MEENLSKKIVKSDLKSQYDQNVKSILSEKIILAYILKQVTREFKDADIEEIKEKYIEDIENEGSIIIGQNSEDIEDGKVVYDIVFSANVPNKQEKIKLIINIEAQKDDKQGYELVTRGQYYGARLISSQKGRIFDKSNYQKLQKVYSIWICMNANKAKRNSMNVYQNIETNIIGNYQAKKEDYDLINVIILYLDISKEGEEKNIIDFLGLLLSDKIKAEEKVKKLRQEYEIKTDVNFERKVDEMCNLGQGIEDRALERGIIQGKAKGENKILSLISKMISNGEGDKVEQITTDVKLREQLFKKYHIE